VKKFANFLEELEEDIPEMSHEVAQAWSLLNGLRSEVRSGVLREEREIRSREQVIAAAQRIHELDDIAGNSPVIRSRGASGEVAQSIGSELKSSGTEGKVTCYQCGKDDHIARRCPEKKPSSK
jgi:SOS response regulatory protein OraA/RecX